MADEIKEGTTVQLKSGGPIMTVVGFKNALAICTWFDASGKRGDAAYPPSALKLVPGL